jgi:hypothetical protein
MELARVKGAYRWLGLPILRQYSAPDSATPSAMGIRVLGQQVPRVNQDPHRTPIGVSDPTGMLAYELLP